MAKVIEIVSCSECIFLKRIATKEFALMPHCGHPKKADTLIYEKPSESKRQWSEIPDWCPLPDAEGKDNGKESEVGDD